MAINFNTLPKNNPSQAIPAGTYFAKVVKSEMIKAKEAGKKDYVALTYECFTQDKKRVGLVFDKFFESDKELPLFKISRFLRAIGVDITQEGAINLSDIPKVAAAKKFIVDITQTKNEYKGKESVKAEPNLFKDGIFYLTSETEAFGNQDDLGLDNPFEAVPKDDNEFVLDAEDAEPSDVTSEEDDY